MPLNAWQFLFSWVPKQVLSEILAGSLCVLSLTVFREKFWRVGNKERDGEYGACFFPQNKGLLVSQPPLLFCARPGSRIWEANFNGEVLSTHQFKQLLACPPLPLITYRFICFVLVFVLCNRSNSSIVFYLLMCLFFLYFLQE